MTEEEKIAEFLKYAAPRLEYIYGEGEGMEKEAVNLVGLWNGARRAWNWGSNLFRGAKNVEQAANAAKATGQAARTARAAETATNTAKGTEQAVNTARGTEQAVNTAKGTEQAVNTAKGTEQAVNEAGNAPLATRMQEATKRMWQATKRMPGVIGKTVVRTAANAVAAPATALTRGVHMGAMALGKMGWKGAGNFGRKLRRGYKFVEEGIDTGSKWGNRIGTWGGMVGAPLAASYGAAQLLTEDPNSWLGKALGQYSSWGQWAMPGRGVVGGFLFPLASGKYIHPAAIQLGAAKGTYNKLREAGDADASSVGFLPWAAGKYVANGVLPDVINSTADAMSGKGGDHGFLGDAGKVALNTALRDRKTGQIDLNALMQNPQIAQALQNKFLPALAQKGSAMVGELVQSPLDWMGAQGWIPDFVPNAFVPFLRARAEEGLLKSVAKHAPGLYIPDLEKYVHNGIRYGIHRVNQPVGRMKLYDANNIGELKM